MPRDERTARERTERDRQAQARARAAEPALHRVPGVVRVRGVDEPRLERSRVEHPEEPLQQHRDREHPEPLGEQEQHRGDDREHPREEQHGAASDRVGEAARGQLEGEHDEALHGEDDAELGERQAAFERQQHCEPEHEPHGQPSCRRQQHEAPLGLPGRDRRHAPGAGDAGAASGGSSSTGRVNWKAWMRRARGSPRPASR